MPDRTEAKIYRTTFPLIVGVAVELPGACRWIKYSNLYYTIAEPVADNWEITLLSKGWATATGAIVKPSVAVKVQRPFPGAWTEDSDFDVHL